MPYIKSFISAVIISTTEASIIMQKTN